MTDAVTVSRADALIAWLRCGYSDKPTDRLLEVVAHAVAAGRTLAKGSMYEHMGGTWAGKFPRVRDAAQILIDNDLMDIRLVRKLGPTGSFLTGAEYCDVLLTELLIPVYVYASYDAAGTLDTKKVETAAKRTRKSIADGKQVTLQQTATRYHVPVTT